MLKIFKLYFIMVGKHLKALAFEIKHLRISIYLEWNIVKKLQYVLYNFQSIGV